MPSPNGGWLPNTYVTDLSLWSGHLAAGHVGADCGRSYIEEGGRVLGGPPVLRQAIGHLPRLQRESCSLACVVPVFSLA